MIKIIKFLKNYFPGILLFVRMPACISWVAVSSAIIVSKKIVPSLLHTPLNSFYYSFVTCATISLIVAIITKKQWLRFLGFFLFSVLFLCFRENKQSSISSLFAHNKNFYTKIYGTLLSYPTPINGGYKFLVKCISSSVNESGIINGLIVQCNGVSVPPPSCQLELYGICNEPKKPETQYDFDEYINCAANGIYVKMNVDSLKIISKNRSFSIAAMFRERVLRILDRFEKPVHSAILRAAFLGEKEYLDTSTKTYFRNSGIYHLLAISGLHAGMLIAASYLLLSIFPLSTRWKHVTVLIILWSYQIFIGFMPSLFRATIMSSFLIISLLFQKKNYALQSLGFAGTCWLILSPESLFLPGYQLSFSATLGIITLYPVLNQLRPKLAKYPVPDFFLTKFFSVFNVSFAGFLSTLPVLIYHFGSISLYGLIANLAAVSLMTYCMWAFFLSILLEPLSLVVTILTKISAQSLDFLIWISRSVRYAPWSLFTISTPSVIPVLLYCTLLVGTIFVNKKYLEQWLLWSMPLFFSLIPVYLMINSEHNKIRLYQFSQNRIKVTAVTWPDKGIWFCCNGTEKEFNTIFNSDIKKWMQFNRGTYVKYILCHSQAGSGHLVIKNSDNYSDTASNALQKDCSSLYYGVISDSAGISLKLTGNNTWIQFNCSDSIFKTGTLYSDDTLKKLFPTVIHLKSKFRSRRNRGI
ncbi:MAG: ComEC/Rec2 family competence protein [Fibrobacter sp.]|nr:ComEC/Rec2 family competence protein [Fibrobacter sp.]